MLAKCGMYDQGGTLVSYSFYRMFFISTSLLWTITFPTDVLAQRGSLLNQPNGSPAPKPPARLDLLNQVRQKPKPPAIPMQPRYCAPRQLTPEPQSSISLPQQNGKIVDTRGNIVSSMTRSFSPLGQGPGQSTSQIIQSYDGHKAYSTPQFTRDPGDTIRNFGPGDTGIGGGKSWRGDLPAGNLDMSNITRW